MAILILPDEADRHYDFIQEGNKAALNGKTHINCPYSPVIGDSKDPESKKHAYWLVGYLSTLHGWDIEY